MKRFLIYIWLIIAAVNVSPIIHGQTTSSNNLYVLTQLNYLRNLGRFGESWSQAVGGYIGYGVYYPSQYMLLIRSGFMSHTLRTEENIDGSLNIIPVQIGGRYYLSTSRFMPFFQFMNGFNIVFEDLDLTGNNNERTLFKYFWQVGTGGTFQLSENISLDISINYNSAFYDNNKELYHEEGAMMNGFEYSAGLGWRIK